MSDKSSVAGTWYMRTWFQNFSSYFSWLSPITATIRLVQIRDDLGNDITASRQSISESFFLTWETRNAQQVCLGFDDDPTDGINPGYGGTCNALPINNIVSVGSSLPGSSSAICAIAVDSNNRYTAPS